jgi:Tfp pilus assembly protein PilX
MIHSIRRRDEGYVLVTAIVLLGIMMTVGLAVMTLADSGTRRSREQRVRESALNLAEGVLYGQGFVLANNWPSAATAAYPTQCLSSGGPVTGGGTIQCPNRDILSQANSSTPAAAVFKGDSSAGATDFITNGSWTARVRDDYGALTSDYSTSVADGALTGTAGTCPGPCTWDYNGNRRMWVQVTGLVRGKKRVLVAKLQLEQVSEVLPAVALTSGALQITNNGNSIMVDDTGSNAQVRCTPNPNNARNSNCARYDDGQIAPSLPQQTTSQRLMEPDQLARFKDRARTDGTYFSGCPPLNADLSGRTVWVEGCANAPSYANQLVTKPCAPEAAPMGLSQNCINQIDAPGLLIWHCGQVDMQGGLTYVGVIYVANNSDGTCTSPTGQIGNGRCSGNKDREAFDAFVSNGGFGIWGALSVDGPACAKLGSNGFQMKYDARVFGSVSSYGAIGLIQNTWRELPPS